MTVHFNVVAGKLRHFWELVGESGNYHVTKESRIVPKSFLYPPVFDVFRAASLDLNFAKNRTLADRVSGNNLITFSRAGSGAYVDSDGLIKTATTDTPRFDYDPATGESLGLLIEEARTNLLTHSQTFQYNRSQSGYGVRPFILANQIAAPDGTNTADEAITLSTTAQNRLLNPHNVTAFQTYTYSVFVKYKNTNGINFTLANGKANAFLSFNFSTETVTGSGAQYISGSAGFEKFNNGWYRIYFSASPFASGSTSSGFYSGTTPDKRVYLWGEQLEVGRFPTSYIYTGGSTVTRSADIATIEGNKFAKTNLIEYSERFNDSTWVKYGSNATPNATTAPDGTTTAEKLNEDNGNSFHRIRRPIASQTTGTFSIYVKADERTKFEIGTSDTAVIAVFDLSSESVTSGTGTINSDGNGWYRCSVTGTFTTNGPYFLLRNSTSEFYQGDGSSGLYIWGAQLEEGSELTEYTPSVESFVSRASSATYVDDATGLITTAAVDTARYENGELLLESARTNLVVNSVSGEIHAATNMTGPTSVYGPGGTDTAFQYLSTGGTIASRIQFKTIVAANATQYTATVYVKGVNYNQVNFGFSATGFGTNSRRTFYLNTLTTQGVGGSAAAVSIEDAGNGWRRLRITTTATTTATGITAYIDLGSPGSETHTTDQGFQFYGFQIEAGTFPTSYIPTSGSAVTRAADVSTSALGVDTWYNQSEGAMFVEAKNYPHPVTGKALAPFAFSDNTYNNRITLAGSTGNDQFNFDVTVGGSQQRAILGNFVSSVLKASGGYKSTGSAGSLDGAAVVTSNTPNIPSVISQIDIGQAHDGNNILNGHISRFVYFPTRLSDDKLKSITT